MFSEQNLCNITKGCQNKIWSILMFKNIVKWRWFGWRLFVSFTKASSESHGASNRLSASLELSCCLGFSSHIWSKRFRMWRYIFWDCNGVTKSGKQAASTWVILSYGIRLWKAAPSRPDYKRITITKTHYFSNFEQKQNQKTVPAKCNI